MRLPGNIVTGLLEGSGTRSEPELQRAAHALCSSEHMAAVKDGFVRVGVAMELYPRPRGLPRDAPVTSPLHMLLYLITTHALLAVFLPTSKPYNMLRGGILAWL